MSNFLYNPWVIGIGVTVVGGLVLYYVFGVGRTRKVINRNNPTGTRIGILNEGKNNSFINNTVAGFDIGIKDKGEKTEARGNKIF